MFQFNSTRIVPNHHTTDSSEITEISTFYAFGVIHDHNPIGRVFHRFTPSNCESSSINSFFEQCFNENVLVTKKNITAANHEGMFSWEQKLIIVCIHTDVTFSASPYFVVYLKIGCDLSCIAMFTSKIFWNNVEQVLESIYEFFPQHNCHNQTVLKMTYTASI